MQNLTERRREQRLRYNWPVWFAEDFDDVLSQGQMVDVSSGGAAFTCHADQDNLHPDQNITARFSVPHYGLEGSFDMGNFTRTGRVCRIENVNNFVRRIALQFTEPLPFKPGEQDTDKNVRQSLEAVSV